MMKKIDLLILFIFSVFFLFSCAKMRESAGVTRKSIDEFQAVENPPLIIPPDFNLVEPDKLQRKNIDNIERDLAQEILFGLNEDKQNLNNQLSTMNTILIQTKATETTDDIREEIDQEFAQEKNTDSIFQMEWENEIEVLDAVKESERIRNKNFEGKSIDSGNVPIKKETVKIKKKKRFIFF